MDTFIEQIVAVRKTPVQLLAQIMLWVLAVILIVALLLLGPLLGQGMMTMIAVLGAFGVGYGAFRLSSNMSVEYEYSVTNEYFDLDRIVARRKRKRALSVQCKDFESFGRYNEAQHAHRNYDKRLIAGNPGDEAVWFATVRVKDLGFVLLVFQPDERVLNAIKKYLPRQVAHDAFRGQ